jgi:hypothetical protein
MRARFAVLIAALPVAVLTTIAPTASAGVSGPAFYVDGTLYRTVATPTDLSRTGAPDSTFDAIYAFNGHQPNVAEAAPGDTDYNGGRWQVHALSFPSGYQAALSTGDTNGNGVIDSTDELALALANGTAVDTGVVRMFECTVNPVPQN